jgi:cytochrome bd-type quinol oxidase subunit 1
MVSLGSIFSAVWIIVANSWQQTPSGHRITEMLRDEEFARRSFTGALILSTITSIAALISGDSNVRMVYWTFRGKAGIRDHSY